jgi:hypothetical protein
MAVIYLTHPIHGAKVAISEEEAINDSMYGWSRVDDPAMLAEPSYHPLDHDGDGHLGGSLSGENSTRRRGRRRAAQEE